jgi:hypothetical protein
MTGGRPSPFPPAHAWRTSAAAAGNRRSRECPRTGRHALKFATLTRFLPSKCMNAVGTPTAFDRSAQGCAPRATVGAATKTEQALKGFYPRAGPQPWLQPLQGCRLSGLNHPGELLPSQPWADGSNTFGVHRAFLQPDWRNRINRAPDALTLSDALAHAAELSNLGWPRATIWGTSGAPCLCRLPAGQARAPPDGQQRAEERSSRRPVPGSGTTCNARSMPPVSDRCPAVRITPATEGENLGATRGGTCTIKGRRRVRASALQ